MSRQILGVDVTKVTEASETPEFRVGTTAVDYQGNTFIYCKAGGTIADKTPVSLAASFVASASGSGGAIDAVTVAGVSLAVNEHFWAQIQGLVESANVASGVSAGNLLAVKADANGDFQPISATSSTDGAHAIRAKAFGAESGGLADIYLY